MTPELYEWPNEDDECLADMDPEHDAYSREDDIYEWLQGIATGELKVDGEDEVMAFIGWVPVANIPEPVRYLFADKGDIDNLKDPYG